MILFLNANILISVINIHPDVFLLASYLTIHQRSFSTLMILVVKVRTGSGLIRRLFSVSLS